MFAAPLAQLLRLSATATGASQTQPSLAARLGSVSSSTLAAAAPSSSDSDDSDGSDDDEALGFEAGWDAAETAADGQPLSVQQDAYDAGCKSTRVDSTSCL